MEFYGLLGKTLKHSLSPDIHQEIYRMTTIHGAYKLFEVTESDLPKAVAALKLLTIKGTNVTIPYKQTILPYLDSISPEATRMQAVNTVLLKNGKLMGYNTDYHGFGMIFENNAISIQGKTATLLGNGGSAKMAITYLLDHGIQQIQVVSRKRSQRPTIVHPKISYLTYETISSISSDLLINTTPIGMYPNCGASPVNEQVISQHQVLIDLIYNPIETLFLETGRRLNKSTYNGLEMLIGQAIKSVEIWQEQPISPAVSQKIIKDFQEKFKQVKI